MSLASDLRTLYALTLAPIAGESHAERLENFYARQARDYDHFRERLLHGRDAMIQSLQIKPGMRFLDLGGGTGYNLEYLGEKAEDLEEIMIVDLSQSLLAVAKGRADQKGLKNVHFVHGDITKVRLPKTYFDCITFSYSITMIPNWEQAILNAVEWLKPGGRIGVVDFHHSKKNTLIERAFWKNWFRQDHVYLNEAHVNMLKQLFQEKTFYEGFGKVPYLPGLRAPYYYFVGKKFDIDSIYS